MTKAITYKKKTMVGIHEGDGTYTIRALKRKNNKIGWTVLSSFTQQTANIDVLTPIQKAVGGCMTSFKDRGRNTSRLDINFNTPAGRLWKSILKKNKPLVPGKRRDYLISLKIHNWATNGVLPGLDQICKSNPKLRREKVGSVVSLILCYNTTNQSQRDPSSVQNYRKASFCSWIKYLRPTLDEFKCGKELGRALLREIVLEENQLKLALSRTKLPSSYLVGYFIADGSLGVFIKLQEPYTSLSVVPRLEITESGYCKNILDGVLSTLGCGNINPATQTKAAYRFTINGWEKCCAVVLPLLSRYALPKSRQAQFNTFRKACEMGIRGEHLTRAGFQRMLKLVWTMNNEGKGRTLTEEQVLLNAEKYFDYHESQHTLMRSYFHSALLQKHGAKLKQLKQLKHSSAAETQS